MSERRHLRPGHHWVCEFGDAGNGSCEEMACSGMDARAWKLHKGTRYYNGEAAIVVKRWFHRTDDDPSGRTFVEWDPKGPNVAADAPPVAMLFNSIKLRAVFGAEDFRQVLPLGTQTRARTGARVQQLEGVGKIRYILQESRDETARDACIAAGSVLHAGLA